MGKVGGGGGVGWGSLAGRPGRPGDWISSGSWLGGVRAVRRAEAWLGLLPPGVSASLGPKAPPPAPDRATARAARRAGTGHELPPAGIAPCRAESRTHQQPAPTGRRRTRHPGPSQHDSARGSPSRGLGRLGSGEFRPPSGPDAQISARVSQTTGQRPWTVWYAPLGANLAISRRPERGVKPVGPVDLVPCPVCESPGRGSGRPHPGRISASHAVLSADLSPSGGQRRLLVTSRLDGSARARSRPARASRPTRPMAV